MWAVTAVTTLSYILIVGGTKGQKQRQQEKNWRSQHSSFFFLELKITPGKLQPETGAAFRSPCCLYVQAAGEGLCAEISSGCLMSRPINTPPMGAARPSHRRRAGIICRLLTGFSFIPELAKC